MSVSKQTHQLTMTKGTAFLLEHLTLVTPIHHIRQRGAVDEELYQTKQHSANAQQIPVQTVQLEILVNIVLTGANALKQRKMTTE